MSAEACCPICGVIFYYEVRDYQTSSMSLICEVCLEDEKLMAWYLDRKLMPPGQDCSLTKNNEIMPALRFADFPGTGDLDEGQRLRP